jgi:hypothetical protein
MNNYVRCPLQYVEIPHWGPEIQLKSALFNRDLITIDECSVCDNDCDCRDPDDPDPLSPLDPEQLCERWSGDDDCPDGYDCIQHKCLTPLLESCLKADAYGCRKCLEPQLPTIIFTAPSDYSELILDPDADNRGRLNIACETGQVMKPNSGPGSDCDSDTDCQSRLTSPNYSDFRDDNPNVTEDDIFCKDDECYFYPACPEGNYDEEGDYECVNNGCDPIPFGLVPPLTGIVDLTLNATGGSGTGAEGELTDFKVKKAKVHITKLNSDLEPLPDTLQTKEIIDADNTFTVKWDTTEIASGYTPEGVFQLEAEVFDTGDLEGYDIIYVRVKEDD